MKGRKSNIKITEKMIRTFLDINSLENANTWETPRRVAKLWDDFLNTEKPILKTFPTENQEMVLLKNYVNWGFCPHHLLPIRYTFKIGYIPRDKVVGLSKLPKLADYYISKLPLQEDLPCLIVNDLNKLLNPLGCGCQVRGYHLCCAMRGIKSENMEFVTTALKGVMLFSGASQQEFLTE